jgi:general stress protein 26
MPTPQELEAKLWKALESDRTVMLGLDGAEDGHTRPMTAQVEGSRGPIWFFTSKDNGLVTSLGSKGAGADRAIATFASKGHDVFATFHGRLSVDTDRAVVDRLWNRFVAAWYPGGKDDPKLALLRLDAERAEIWLEGSSIVAGVKMLLGVDPKKDYKDNVAEISLRQGGKTPPPSRAH